MAVEARAGLHLVTWIDEDDEKKAAIVSFRVQSTPTGGLNSTPINQYNEYHVYAEESSAESEHLAFQDMLLSLQLEMGAFMPSIAARQRAIVLDNDSSESVSSSNYVVVRIRGSARVLSTSCYNCSLPYATL